MPQLLHAITRLFTRQPAGPFLVGPAVPLTYTPAAEPQHAAGQLWLRPLSPAPDPTAYGGGKQYPEPFKLAVDCYPSRTQGARNDNKLVLGGAGSGRSIMLARLTEAAHAAGNHVVAFTTGGPVEAVGERLHGRGVSLSTAAPASFNPFWFPVATLDAEQKPGEPQLSKLASLLLALFGLTKEYFVPVGADGTPLPLQELLVQELRGYYRFISFPSVWGNTQHEWPAFDSFYDMTTYGMGITNQGVDYEEFLRWLTVVGLPYFHERALGKLLNASPDLVTALMDSPNRFLQFTLDLDESAATTVDSVDFRRWPGGPAAPEAEVRVLLLLLHTADVHLSSPIQRLTVVLDELHYSLLGPQFAAYLTDYLREGHPKNRDLLIAWHEDPDRVFGSLNPAAQRLLAACDTQVFTTYQRVSVADHDCLQLSDATKALLLSTRVLSREAGTSTEAGSRKVLVRIPADGPGEVFHAFLPREATMAYWCKSDRRWEKAGA